MKICKKCGAKYPDSEEICSIDGQKLIPLPEFLQTRPSSHSSHPPADPFIGKQIEKYRILKQIGEGGMGVVYEAEHIHIGKKVALKILREDYTKKQDVVERFKQEARSASIIGHPNIIDVTDFGYTNDGRVFFIMEYLEGEDLATILENERALKWHRAVKIALQVCHGLEAAHSKGIIHRDMKPENIFIVHPNTKDEKVKILDFGIAKMSILDHESKRLTRTGVVFGTPEYMSPEQAAGKTIDKRVDIYSLGVIMYEMITSKVPFTGDSFMAILSKHIFDKVPPLKEVSPNLHIPESLEKTIYKCLEKEPENRFESAAQLASALESVLSEDETTVSVEIKLEPPKTGQTPKPRALEIIGEESFETKPKKNKLLWITLLALFITGALGGSYYLYEKKFQPKKSLSGIEKKQTKFLGDTNKNLSITPINNKNTTISTLDTKTPVNQTENNKEETMRTDSESPEKVELSIKTIPQGATVAIEGKGEICPITPCSFSAQKGKEITLVLKYGNLLVKQNLIPMENPTELTIPISKQKKSKVGKPVTGGEKAEKEKNQDWKPKKIKNIDTGDLKTPEIFK